MKNEILDKQREFQRLCEVNIDTIVDRDINALSEMYLFKAIEEIIELRKTFPSELNRWSKSQPTVDDRERILAELADVHLFLSNFCLVRKISPDELNAAIRKVQENNFSRLKMKKYSILMEEMSRGPGELVLPVPHSYNPDVIVVSLFPLPESHFKYVTGELANASAKLRISPEDFYFTSVVKQHTFEENDTSIKYWTPFFARELEILTAGKDSLILALDKSILTIVSEISKKLMLSVRSVHAPEEFFKFGYTAEQYFAQQILPKLRFYSTETKIAEAK